MYLRKRIPYKADSYLIKRVNQFVNENNAKKIVNFLKVPIPRHFLFDENNYIP